MNRLCIALIGVIGAWLAMLTFHVLTKPEDASRDYPQFCVPGSDGIPTCRISLASLAFNPALVDGRRIESLGLVVVDQGFLAIYAPGGAFAARDRRQAVRVKMPEAEQRRLAASFRGKVIAFRAKVDATDAISLQNGFMGALRELENVGEVVIATDSGLPESDGLLIDADDLSD